jgi:hypothetical protein
VSCASYRINGYRAVCRRTFQITDEYQRYFQMYWAKSISPSGEEFNTSAPVYIVVNKVNANVFS